MHSAHISFFRRIEKLPNAIGRCSDSSDQGHEQCAGRTHIVRTTHCADHTLHSKVQKIRTHTSYPYFSCSLICTMKGHLTKKFTLELQFLGSAGAVQVEECRHMHTSEVSVWVRMRTAHQNDVCDWPIDR